MLDLYHGGTVSAIPDHKDAGMRCSQCEGNETLVGAE